MARVEALLLLVAVVPFTIFALAMLFVASISETAPYLLVLLCFVAIILAIGSAVVSTVLFNDASNKRMAQGLLLLVPAMYVTALFANG